MKNSGSMNDYIEKAVKRYSSLFTLPTHSKLLVLLLAVCTVNGVMVTSSFLHASTGAMAIGLGLGIILFLAIMLTDFLIHLTSFQGDLIFNLRRCSALSFYSATFWLGFIILGTVTNFFLPGSWFKLFLIGFCSVLILRFLVLKAVSFAWIGKICLYAGLLPVVFATTVIVETSLMGEKILDASVALFFFLSLAVTLSAIAIFLYSVDQVGVGIVGTGSFSVLRAFLANWTEDLNGPLETIFEKSSLEHDISVSILAFRTNEKLTTLAVVPAFHPGPFKNVGSSSLPQDIQSLLEEKLHGCVVSVPHGLSGHDLDLASQSQNQTVMKCIDNMTDFSGFGSLASPFVRVDRNGAVVGCQVFGDCALVTLTLAPDTMEDLPSDLSSFIQNEARKIGLSTAICIDAHNSIQGSFKAESAIAPLKEAVAICLKELGSKRLQGFEVGVAKTLPVEFDLRDGMGHGGIVVTMVKTGEQTVAYVTIDGNNMISGLREKILSALSELGVDCGEVLTTDTHAVNAVVLNARGYHPVGEAMDQQILIDHIKRTANRALEDLKPAEVAWRTETVSRVKVIGENQIQAMCMLADKTMQKAKKMAIFVFPLAGVLLLTLLLLF